MTRTLLPALTVAAIAACTATPDKDSTDATLHISDTSQGKMRNVGDEWVIYEETDDMVYEVNDQCVYNEEKVDCLRHGFIIRYDSGGEDIKLPCIARTNIKVDAGNVAEEKYVDTYRDDFYMPLKGGDTRFVNVQYVTGHSELDLKIHTSCTHNERDVFELNQRIRFP